MNIVIEPIFIPFIKPNKMNWKASLQEITKIFSLLLLIVLLILLYLIFRGGILATIVGNVHYFVLSLFVLAIIIWGILKTIRYFWTLRKK